MIFSSMYVILVVLPSAILQYFTYRRLCSPLYCQLEGFVSYLNGCVHMFLQTTMSIIRYVTVLYASAVKRRFRRRSNLALLISWLLGLVFAVPPLFKCNRFVPQGLAFRCGLNWFDQSTSSYIYLFSMMLFVYFIPLGVLSILNADVYYVIRWLIYRTTSMNEKLVIAFSFVNVCLKRRPSPTYLSASSTTTHSSNSRSIRKPKESRRNTTLANRQLVDPIQMRHAIRLNRLKADRRFALATIFLVAEYLLSWTPYACVALFYLFHMTFIVEQPPLISVCAFIAKVSMMINPFIYILAIRTNQSKTDPFLSTLYLREVWNEVKPFFVTSNRCTFVWYGSWSV